MNSTTFLSSRNGLDKIDKKQMSITVAQFGLIVGCEPTNVIFKLRTVREEIMVQKERFAFYLCRLK